MKTRYILSTIVFCLFAGLWTSCENDGFYYQDEARIRLEGPELWTVGSDSLEFSFSTYPEETTEMPMTVSACVIGVTTDYDRTANITVDAAKTTATADLYELPSTVTIPAGENVGTFDVVLKRGAVLDNTTVRLYICVAPSSDFAVGNNEENHLLLKWNNTITRPSNWDDELAEHFGEYSDTKYRFMLANAGGVSEFSSETMNWSDLHNYNIIFNNALNEYNQAHPGAPLTDENGVLVTFPQN